MELFHKHDYEIIKEYELKSTFEQMMENGLSSITSTINKSMMEGKLVIVYKCKKCKKIKETIISKIY